MRSRGSASINNNFKVVLAFIFAVFIIIGTTIYVFNELFLNKTNAPQLNIFLYTKVLNTSMPIVQVTSYDEENMAEEKDSVEGELVKLVGIDMNNPISIMSREVSFFKEVNYKTTGQSVPDDVDAQENSKKNGTSGIEPFVLNPGQVSRNNSIIPGSASSQNGNTPGASGSTSGQGNTGTSATPDNANTDNSNTKVPPNASKPDVLIYHTHTTESYGDGGNFNEDPSKNVCAVGDVLAKELESKYGIGAIHDKTVHIYPSYNDAYSKSRETVNKYLKQYGDFKLIIDLHRDTAYSKNSVTTKLNNEDVTKIRFVLCRKNPHYDENYSAARSLQSISNRLFPGFCRDIYYFNYGTKFFNQDLSNNAILIEVGANINSLNESKNSGKYLARIISEYLSSKK